MNCYYFYCPNYTFEYVSVWANTPWEAEKICASYVGRCYIQTSRPQGVPIGYLY